MPENLQEELEDKVIDLIISGALGRLIIFKPENSGKDLIVEKRGDYKKKAISLNVYEKEFFGKISTNKEENFYLVFVRFDIVKQDIDDEIIVVSAMNSSKFLINKKDLAGFLLEKLEEK